jgi:multidrug resistance efflux pump
MPLQNKIHLPTDSDEPAPNLEAPSPARALQHSLEQQFGASESKQDPRKITRLNQRIFKSAVGVAFVVACAIQPVRALLETSSVEAVVNAPLLTLRAPIDGVVSFDGPSVVVDDPRADSGRVEDAERSLVRFVDERQSLQRRRSAAVAEMQRQTTQLELFRKGRISQLEARLSELDHRIVIADLQGQEASERASRAAKLAGQAVSLVEAEQTKRSLAIAREAALAARAQSEQARIELEAARNGSFLGDSYNDAPSSAQKADDLRRQIGDLDADIALSDAKIVQARRDLDTEKRRFEHLTRAVLVPPPKGRLWERLALPGENVSRGQDLARYIDCSTQIVTATVSESTYNALVIGQSARFLAADGVELGGRVVNLTGPSGANANLAISPAALRKAAFRVEVSFPSSGAACDIGRTGRLIFGKRE